MKGRQNEEMAYYGNIQGLHQHGRYMDLNTMHTNGSNGIATTFHDIILNGT
jgi:hypothetical protein